MTAPVFGTPPAEAVIDLGPSRGSECPTRHTDRAGRPAPKPAHRFQVGDHVVLACLPCAARRWPKAFGHD